MTKKDFEAIAAIVRNLRDADEPFAATHALRVGRKLAIHFVTRNPRFDRERFYSACGLNSTGSTDE